MRTKQLSLSGRQVDALLVAGGPGFKIYTVDGRWVILAGKDLIEIAPGTSEEKLVSAYSMLKYQPKEQQAAIQDEFERMIQMKKSKKMRNPEGLFIVSKTYEIVTPESAEEGDAEERGFEFENTKMTLAEVLSEVRDLGSHVVQRDGSTRISLYGQGESVDYRTGDTTTYALHIRGPSRAISRLEDILVPGRSRKRASADKRERGIIKWFGKTKGFGFIASSSVDRDIFFHYADIRDWEDLLETELDGREVEFTIEDTMKGPIARDIKVLRITRKNPSSRRDSQTYTYHFHEERGDWWAYVEDEEGNTVWEARAEDEEDGEFWPARDGFMRDAGDTRGLEKYLKSLEILPMSAALVMGD